MPEFRSQEILLVVVLIFICSYDWLGYFGLMDQSIQPSNTTALCVCSFHLSNQFSNCTKIAFNRINPSSKTQAKLQLCLQTWSGLQYNETIPVSLNIIHIQPRTMYSKILNDVCWGWCIEALLQKCETVTYNRECWIEAELYGWKFPEGIVGNIFWVWYLDKELIY